MTQDEAMLEARYRAEVLDAVDAANQPGFTMSFAVGQVAAHYGIHGRTIWRWMEMFGGLTGHDRLVGVAEKKGALAELRHLLPAGFSIVQSGGDA